jgi:hypothetical protein
MPFSLALVSLATHQRPENVYSAFAALINVVLTLSTFALARIALGWTRARSATAAVIVAANALLLFGTFYGWQGQLLLTAFGLLAIAGTYAAVARGPEPALVLVGGLGAAAGVSLYGAAFGSFILLVGVIVATYVATHRDLTSRRRAARSVGAIALLTLALAAIPIGRAVLQTGSFLGQSSTTSLWSTAQAVIPSEPLGLIPRSSSVTRVSERWTVLSLFAAVPLYAVGFLCARGRAGKEITVWGSAAALLVIGLLVLLDPNRYLSMKLAGYSAPLLILTVLSPRALPGRRGRWPSIVLVGLAGTLFVFSTAFVEVRAARDNQHASMMASLERATDRLPPEQKIAVDIDDAWHQAWAIYFLRSHPLEIPRPQYFLPGSLGRLANEPASLVLAARPAGHVLWRGVGLVLSTNTQRVRSATETPLARELR